MLKVVYDEKELQILAEIAIMETKKEQRCVYRKSQLQCVDNLSLLLEELNSLHFSAFRYHRRELL
jgi:hypothetical protein